MKRIHLFLYFLAEIGLFLNHEHKVNFGRDCGLSWSCAGNHGCPEFIMSGIFMSCPEHNLNEVFPLIFFSIFFSPYSNVKLIAQFWSWVNLVSMYYIIMVDFIGEDLVWASASISVTGIFLYLFFLSLPPTPPSQGSDWARELGWCKKDVSVFKCGFILVVLERAQASTVALPLGCAFGPVYLIS